MNRVIPYQELRPIPLAEHSSPKMNDEWKEGGGGVGELGWEMNVCIQNNDSKSSFTSSLAASVIPLLLACLRSVVTDCYCRSSSKTS